MVSGLGIPTSAPGEGAHERCHCSIIVDGIGLGNLKPFSSLPSLTSLEHGTGIYQARQTQASSVTTL